MYDVAVIGGGPVGSQVAYGLAGMGYEVVVLERKGKLGEPVCCTGIISRECVDSFAIDEDVIFKSVNSAKLFAPSRRLLRLWRQEPQAAIVDRAAFDATLASRAQDRGAEYALNILVRNIEVGDDRVRVEAVRQGERLVFEARVAVIATGFGSTLTGELGLGRVGDSVMGTQAEVEAIGVNEVEVYCGCEIAPSFFAWLVPTSSGKALVGLLSRRTPGIYLRRLMSSLRAEGKITSDDVELSYGGIPLKPLPRTYGDRLVVVGTVAGQVKPTTGGGIYYGLLCADIAADNLHRALEADDLSGRKLAGYEREWKRKLGRELKTGYWARRFYELLNDRQVDRIFDIMESGGILETLLGAKDLSFDWHGRVVQRVIGHGILMKAIEAMKIPFRPPS